MTQSEFKQNKLGTPVLGGQHGVQSPLGVCRLFTQRGDWVWETEYRKGEGNGCNSALVTFRTIVQISKYIEDNASQIIHGWRRELQT